MPPAGVQKSNVCFACSSLCGCELDTVLTSTVPLVWAESPWIAEKMTAKRGWFSSKLACYMWEGRQVAARPSTERAAGA